MARLQTRYSASMISLASSIGLLLLRMHHSGNGLYTFLFWNLFLASIPFLISTLVVHWPGVHRKPLLWLPGIGLWLLFFPNAPYLMTDLLHLEPRPGGPLWFDLALLLSFASSGLLLGFLSLSDIQDFLTRQKGLWLARLFAFFALIASAYGIYLGRFLRWNSWDLITHPRELLRDISTHFLQPQAHFEVIVVTGVFGFLLGVWYITFRWLTSSQSGTRPKSQVSGGQLGQ